MKYRIIFGLLIFTLSAYAQPADKLLKAHFKNIQKQKTAQLSKEQAAALLQDEALFQQLGKYIRSDQKAVQQEAIRLARQLGSIHPAERSRKQAVHLLLEATRSKHPIALSSAADALQQFRPGDFDELAKQRLADLLHSRPAQLDKLLLTAGFLQLEAALETLRPELQKRSAARRALNLALTRCGNQQKSASMMKNIRQLPIDDAFVYQVVPMMVYTRQRPQMDFLLDLVLSDKRSCHTPGENAHGHTLCGYRVIEQIAPVIEDFPVQLNEATGDLAVNDYKKAMSEVRDWIRANRTTYTLKHDIF